MKPEVSFRVIGDSGPLSIYWYPGPYGDAVECQKGSGVCWLSPTGDLLGVEFDDVDRDGDKQELHLPNDCVVSVKTKSGKVQFSLTQPKSKKHAS
jgi:hypothetical protein